jgi:hypothetical protein
MRLISIAGMVFAFACTPMLSGGPTNGGVLEKIEKSPWKVTFKFRAGEKATVLARAASPESKTKLAVTVFDMAGKVIVEATGKNPPSASMVAVYWYPPREAEYQIEVKSADNEPTVCYVTIK